jgi:hypothetical protein
MDLPQKSPSGNIITFTTNHGLPLGPNPSLNALDQSFFPFGPDGTQPMPNVQPAYTGVVAPALPFLDPFKPIVAVVMEHPDGKFFCSQLGCDAVYLRAGDCRRHLKKHNGPFFHCDQPDCGMYFYRHDKLRAHLKQGHNIVAVAPRRGQRAANSSAYKVVKRGGIN